MPDNITKDFEEYKNKKNQDFKKTKTFEPLSSDIIALREIENGDIETVKGPIEIIQIIDIIKDKDRIKKLEESISGGPVFNTNLGTKEVKPGSVIWITAIVQQPKNTSWNSQQSYVTIQARIVNIYQGLNKLKTIKQ